MTGAGSRRGFLAGLTTLPLVGGAVTLLGRPSAVAEPVTDALLERYLGFVAHEYRDVLIERELRGYERHWSELAAAGDAIEPARRAATIARVRDPDRLSWIVRPGLGTLGHGTQAGPPSSRAALVLSAVGCDWRAARS